MAEDDTFEQKDDFLLTSLTDEFIHEGVRSRAWCFTLNNYNDSDVRWCREAVERHLCRYIVVGQEVAPSGTLHLQGYICFTNKKSLQTLKKLLIGRSHWSAARGDSESNFVYCSKDGNFFEFGDRPASQKRKGDLGKLYYDEAFSNAKQGLLELIPSDLRVRHYETWKRIKTDHQVTPSEDGTFTAFWYYGPTGTGKSRRARELFPGSYFKLANKWFDGYQDQKSIIMDDVDVKHGVWLAYFLKIWTDRYAFQVEIKGGSMMIRPHVFVVTSNYSIRDIFPSVQDYEPLERRFQCVHFDSLIHN